ncbi:MAG: DNA mismatch repair protein MutS [Atopococcus tabaci]|uniref:DNA mismatch repair protein MutS n=1 Tax=Atopococcus tabaci TaxID=269774 RepID=A0AA43RL03_9LACT|nr:DNA mismatch repair protein MutS [Atopococcus tabaci]
MTHKTEDTPMMKQYKEIKANYEDAYLFYRLGDFYELFYTDAEEVSQLLELTLTARNKKADDPIPMCGVPYHSADQYIKKLIQMGHKVAVCEQVEDAKQAKGMVKREVVQLVTPGTVMEESTLDEKENNYLSALEVIEETYYLSYIDLSTGEFKATQLNSFAELINECTTIQTKEILLSETMKDLEKDIKKYLNILISYPRSNENRDLKQYYPADLDQGLKRVADLLLNYLADTQMRQMEHIQPLESYEPQQYLRMGPGARKNLELQVSLKDQSKYGTLYWLLDESKTAMGSRLLKRWLDQPLLSAEQINIRLDAVGNLMNHYFERMDLGELLKKVYDLERLSGRISFQTVNARDLTQLKQSLEQIPHIISLVESINQEGVWDDWLKEVEFPQDIYEKIDQAIVEEPPLSITEGGLIKQGYHPVLDEYLDAMHNGKLWMANLQAEEREATGIKNLKIGFNKVFGYYIEVTKSNLDLVDETRYERKQTLANAERYITPGLKEKESLILEAEEKSQSLEYELFVDLRDEIKVEIERIQKLAKYISMLDVLQSLAEVSERHNFSRPVFHTHTQSVAIKNGRHPVVEKVMGDQTYIPNDVILDDSTDIMLITGPNMSGKSTYMRQLALIIIMAQIGCFVPAESAELPIFDQIYTRIGAMDDLIGGQSTFMVEMMEANEALQNASSQSLLLFDEIGRGTATFDGMALAEAIIGYIHDHIKAKTLFSTHYHELTELEDRMEQLKNVHVGAVEDNQELVFLHKIEDGPADKSYGVQVAKLAGLPDQVIQEADVILSSLIEKSNSPHQAPAEQEERPEEGQISLFEIGRDETEAAVVEQIKELDLANMTLMDVMNLVNELQQRLRQNDEK